MGSPNTGKPPSQGGADASAGFAAPDPLAEFFYQESESAPSVPDVGHGSGVAGSSRPPQQRREFVAFRLGDEEYAVAIDSVQEILKAPVLTEVPRAPAHVAGIVLVRGEVVAVQDPRRRLGLSGTPGVSARVIVCESGSERVGLLVDGVSEVLRLLPSEIEERAQGIASIDADYIEGVGREGDRLVVILNLAALIGRGQQPGPQGRAP
jgi:purine-binding chemotaxis protein CheW